ncbi:MAG: SDR family oxidoreductase [Deltaproteobacteria bacterium]|nr:SDR family oxidoreductase [Deltaproteobacteria bacterium]
MADYLTDLFGLQGKVAALTGAGGFLLSEMSRGLSKAGVRVALLDKNREAVEKVRQEIESEGGQAMVFDVDVTQKGDFQKALEAILGEFGALDFAVFGSNLNASTPFLDIPSEEWDAILDVQLKGTMFGLQVFGGHMLSQGKGSMVTISSASAGPPLSRAFTYSVAKAGVKNLTHNVAREWATKGVRVNALRPGFFPTEWSKTHFIDKDREKAILGHTAMHRYGEPKELLGAVLWLFSDAASFVTGAEIAVDGGFSAMTI